MILYHGSNIKGLECLKPNQADHDRPYVYLSTIEVVAALYLCNAVKKPYYWFPYGFEDGVPVYHELYPNALKEVSEGVSGCIYRVEAEEENVLRFKDIPCARLGTSVMEVVGLTETDDAHVLLNGYIREGRLKVRRYEDKTKKQLQWWYKATADYMNEKGIVNDPNCSYAAFVREKLPEAWEMAELERDHILS